MTNFCTLRIQHEFDNVKKLLREKAYYQKDTNPSPCKLTVAFTFFARTNGQDIVILYYFNACKFPHRHLQLH